MHGPYEELAAAIQWRAAIRIIVADTYYDAFLDDYSRAHPHTKRCSYDDQHDHLMATRFGTSDAYAAGFRSLGHDAKTIVLNAENLQKQWACEHGLVIEGNKRDFLLGIFEAQMQRYQPDVLLIQELSYADDALLKRIKPHVGIIVGQIACSLPSSRTFGNHDLIVSSWPPIVDYFRLRQINAEFVPLGFDRFVLDDLKVVDPIYDVTIVGGLSDIHCKRLELVEFLAERTNLTIFGYGREKLSCDAVSRHRGPAWGMDMYRAIANSRIVINVHGQIRVDGRVQSDLANNMRMFEATGCGSLLLTDMKPNLGDYFDVGSEILAFESKEDCLDQIQKMLMDDGRRQSIAATGQRRTLAGHTIDHRCRDLVEIIENCTRPAKRTTLVSFSLARN